MQILTVFFLCFLFVWGRRGRDRMIVGFTITCAIIAYHHYSSEYEPRSWRGVLDTTLCDFLRIVRFPLPIKLNATILLKYC
jgi:hypothetical protein